MNQAVSVRTAIADDVGAILRVQRAAGHEFDSRQSLADVLADPNRLVAVALAAGQVRGWAKTHYWEKADGTAPAGQYLGGVDVTPEFRRSGIATTLTEARLQWIWQRSADAWYVVNLQNRASIELHRRWNFGEVARGPRFHTTTFTGGTGLLMHARRV